MAETYTVRVERILMAKLLEVVDAARMDEQIQILKEIQNKGFNIITCGLCGEVNLVRLSDKTFKCYVCSEEQQHHDCGDLFF